jgi:hypothetical protein
MAVHVVKQGEHISAIAEKYGFRKHSLVWDDPSNSEIKSERDNPWVLYPGDQLTIPEKQVKTESVATTRVHVFRVPSEKLLLRIVVKDNEGNPIANTPCKLVVAGEESSLTTDGGGKIQKDIPKTAIEGRLTIKDIEVPLKIGHLDPVDKLSGQKARLNNLGYDAGDPAGSEDLQFRSAVEEFQCDQHLAIDGVCGPATQGKLKEVHGA